MRWPSSGTFISSQQSAIKISPQSSVDLSHLIPISSVSICLICTKFRLSIWNAEKRKKSKHGNGASISSLKELFFSCCNPTKLLKASDSWHSGKNSDKKRSPIYVGEQWKHIQKLVKILNRESKYCCGVGKSQANHSVWPLMFTIWPLLKRNLKMRENVQTMPWNCIFWQLLLNKIVKILLLLWQAWYVATIRDEHKMSSDIWYSVHFAFWAWMSIWALSQHCLDFEHKFCLHETKCDT